MADKLVVVEKGSVGYRIQWELDDGDDLGAFLGQGLCLKKVDFCY